MMKPAAVEVYALTALTKTLSLESPQKNRRKEFFSLNSSTTNTFFVCRYNTFMLKLRLFFIVLELNNKSGES